MSDSFISSMTFASGGFGCDCDECGINEIPLPILAALRERKRQKREQTPVKRTQSRSLVKRDPNGVAVWNWILPQDAEPLVEFGNSHRIVWIQCLPRGANLRSIGKGIIGSSDEEKTRKNIKWKNGQIYCVPSNGGKAIGWVHHVDQSDDPASVEKGHILIHTAKIPLEQLKEVKFLEDDLNAASSPQWVASLMNYCHKGVSNLQPLERNGTKTAETGEAFRYYQFNEDDSLAIKAAFAKAKGT